MTQEMRIGFMLRNYTKMRGMTQREFAEKMGLSDTTMLNRSRRPGGWKLEELVRAFDILDVPKEERWL